MTMDIYSHVIPGMGDDNGIMDDLCELLLTYC